MPIVRGFRRCFHSTIISSSRQAATEISNLVAGSNVEQSERSSAASCTSKRPIRKRVTSADRKARLESFVNKYRAMNLGKFPSPTSAQKEVGGSYYLVKKMLQEMEYNVKISSVENEPIKDDEKKTKDENTIIKTEIQVESYESQEVSKSQIAVDQQFYREMISSMEQEPVKENEKKTKDEDTILETEIEVESSESHEVSESQIAMDQQFYQERISSVEKEPVKENEMKTKDEDSIIKKEVEVESSDSQDVSDGQVTMDQQFYEDRGTESVSNLDSSFELKEGLQPSRSGADTGNSNLITREDTHTIVTESHDRKGQCDEKLEQNFKDESPLEDKFTFEDTESNMEKEHGGIQNVRSDMPEQQKDDEPEEKPSIWESMKSLATGFINIWRK